MHKKGILRPLLYVLSSLRWEDRFLALVGFPLGFGPVIRSFPFFQCVLGVCGSFVLIFMLCASQIDWHRQCDVTLTVIPFQYDSTVEAAGPVD